MIHSQNFTFQANDHIVAAYRANPANGGPGVLVLHAWWGLTPFFKELCDRLAEQGYTALAPDLYGGRTAATIDQAQAAAESSNAAYIEAAVLGALEQLQALPGVDPARVGMIGFSFGAAWSLVVSMLRPQNIAAVVLFYGAYTVDFNQAQAAYLGHFSPTDEWEPLEGIQEMQAAMQSAGREATFHFYPGAGHWFFESDRPDAYQPQAAELAWQRSLEFLKERLGA